jgi:tRNA1(Val) A37 N6-methylase TrmN6
MIHTTGHLLDRRLHYAQLQSGHRSGIEPVLLAAAIPAKDGDNVIEAGTGAGAGLLCLAARVANLRGVGIERAPPLAMLAQRNFGDNGFTNLAVIAADITRLPLTDLPVQRRFDHAFANPPWRPPPDTPSPDPIRRLAHQSTCGLLPAWANALAAVLKPRGTLTFILPATSLTDGLDAMTRAGCGAARIMPLWPRSGRPAKLIIVQSRKGHRGHLTLLQGLTLHDEAGYTGPANDILRRGASLPLH